MQGPFVSVIVPVKNGADDLARLLASLEGLVWPRDQLEVIVCDNGSTDGTVSVARAAGCTVLREPLLTVAGLRNAGARVARGEVLAFVDADCRVTPRWLEAAVAQLRRTGVVAAGCYPEVPEGATWVQRMWNLKERVKPSVHEAAWLPSMNLVVWRHAFESVGGFDGSLATCEDVDLCYRLRDRGGRIIWDERIRVVHHGEPATLRILFRKTRWHGSSNLRGWRSHRFRLEEVPSMVLPAMVLGAWVCTAGSFAAGPFFPWVAGPCLMFPVSLAFAGAWRTARRAGSLRVLPHLTLVYYVYLEARALALVDELRG